MQLMFLGVEYPTGEDTFGIKGSEGITQVHLAEAPQYRLKLDLI